MELSDYALQLLNGTSLADKLAPPTMLIDSRPEANIKALPSSPGRPPELALPQPGRGANVPMPSLKELERPEMRGRILHQFANHELLALELMALALLKFPQAPAAWRRSLIATIGEEQKHLRLYQERMHLYGVAFGSVPVSRFFWDALAHTPSPLAFVTQMSLTLEQANLDFSRHFRDIFLRLGDTDTAAVLDVVYREEIGHVRLGVAWFNRWRDPAPSEWDAYVATLPPPLTPSRAKGLGFCAQARREAGLSEDFIAQLAVHNQSKGRPSDVYYFNPGCEDELADGRGAVTLPRRLQTLQSDLASLLAFLAKPDDVVVVTRRPTTNFMTTLTQAGFILPQLVEENAAKSVLASRRLGDFIPWGRTPSAAFHREKMQLNCRELALPPTDLSVFSKIWAQKAHHELSPQTCQTIVTDSMASLERALAPLIAVGPAVIKAPLGASGRHMHQVYAGGLTLPQQAWCRRIFNEQGAVLVEPWLDKVLDLSVQIDSRAANPVIGITRFVTDRRGQYAGHLLGRKYDDLPAAQRRQLHTGDFFSRLNELAINVAARLKAAGYAGPAGIDALVHRNQQGQWSLRPIVEVNTRLTMGRIALALEQHLRPGVRAVWLHLTLKQVQSLGDEHFIALANRLMALHPLKIERDGISAGIMPTTDPAHAQAVVSFLAVGDGAIQSLDLGRAQGPSQAANERPSC